LILSYNALRRAKSWTANYLLLGTQFLLLFSSATFSYLQRLDHLELEFIGNDVLLLEKPL